ncbi:MAG: ROK family transcriptional regulator [Chloroflexi bacterium]|nr:ROK family transcriptional regulator [Chloroflexota bacterium]
MSERSPTRTGDQALVREINLSLIMNHLRDHAPVSRAALAEMTGLNKSTVSSIIRELIEGRFVYEIGLSSSSIGRPSTLLELNPSAGHIIGLEIDVDSISVTCANFAAEMICQQKELTGSDLNQAAVLARALAMVEEAARLGQRKQLNRLLGLALGVPGLVDHETGMLLFAPNLGWENVPLGDILRRRFPNTPIFVDNEANLAALGECFYGAARGYDTVLYISAGIGLGGAIVSQGHLFKGKLGYASEFGHMTLEVDGEPCNCGNRGCWETLVSQPALFRQIRRAVERGEKSVLSDWVAQDWSRLTLPMVLDAAQRSDTVARAALERVGFYLGIGIASLVNALNPDLVVLGGMLSLAGDFLLPVVEAELHRRALRWTAEAVRLVLARHGADACLMGGIAVVHQSILSQSVAAR